MCADHIAIEPGFPRVYRRDERTRHAANFFCVALGGLFSCLTILLLAGILPRGRGSLSGLFWMDLPIAAIVLFIASGNNRRVIFHQDYLEVVGWFHRRKLHFKDIRGRHTIVTPYGHANILVPADPTKRKLGLSSHLHTDQFFRDWIKNIPEVVR